MKVSQECSPVINSFKKYSFAFLSIFLIIYLPCLIQIKFMIRGIFLIFSIWIYIIQHVTFLFIKFKV